jgi:hypothetical protein
LLLFGGWLFSLEFKNCDPFGLGCFAAKNRHSNTNMKNTLVGMVDMKRGMEPRLL